MAGNNRGLGRIVEIAINEEGARPAHGVAEIYTWTQDGNAAMRALNTRLGYATTRTGIQVARALPLCSASYFAPSSISCSARGNSPAADAPVIAAA